MNEEDFFLDENDDDLDSSYIVPTVGEDDDSSDGNEDGDEVSSRRSGSTKSTDVSLYENKLSEREIDMQRKYDDIMKLQKETDIRTTAEIILNANPNNQSTIYIQQILKGIFNAQGHNRMTSGYVQIGQRLNANEVAETLAAAAAPQNYTELEEAQNEAQVAKSENLIEDTERTVAAKQDEAASIHATRTGVELPENEEEEETATNTTDTTSSTTTTTTTSADDDYIEVEEPPAL